MEDLLEFAISLGNISSHSLTSPHEHQLELGAEHVQHDNIGLETCKDISFKCIEPVNKIIHKLEHLTDRTLVINN